MTTIFTIINDRQAMKRHLTNVVFILTVFIAAIGFGYGIFLFFTGLIQVVGTD